MTFAAVAPKIAKLIPRLASEHDSEVVATARAIRRVLDDASADLHDLANLVADVGRPKPAMIVGLPPDWRSLSRGDRSLWLHALARQDDMLSAWEAAFIADIAEKHRSYSGFTLSPKQAARMSAIIAKAWAWGLRI